MRDYLRMDAPSDNLHDGFRLAALMDRAKVKDQAVATACGVTTQAVSKWRRTGVIARKHIPALVGFLMCSSDELLGIKPIARSPATHVAHGDEARLLAMFRRCNANGKASIINWIAAFVSAGAHLH